MGEDFEGAPFSGVAPVALKESTAPTPVGVAPVGPLTPMGWGAEYGLELATAARAMTSVLADGPAVIILPQTPLEFDVRLENRFEQRLASRERRETDPTPRPAGKGEGAGVVGPKIADAIRAIERGVSRNF